MQASNRNSAMSRVVERNIQALIDHHARETRTRPIQQRIADVITAFAGSLSFVALHVAIVLAWTVINVGWTPLPKFDPTFVILATVASVEAIFLTAFVLITQNRMQADADRRADLDLQINLLAEHEITRLLTLTHRIAEKVGIELRDDAELDELERDIVPEQVLDTLDEQTKASEAP